MSKAGIRTLPWMKVIPLGPILRSAAVLATLSVTCTVACAVACAVSCALASSPDPSPQVLARGEYLVSAVANCLVCHSPRQWQFYAGPVAEEAAGAGADLGYLGLGSAPAIDGKALAGWSEEEAVALLLQGRNPQGQERHGFLPGGGFRSMTRDDARAVIAYLRTLAPSASGPAMKGETRAERTRVPGEARTAAVSRERGEALLQLASCRFCHGLQLKGGKEFQIPGRPPVGTRDISDPTRAGGDRESFIGRFRAFAGASSRDLPSPPSLSNTVMPWTHLGRMSEEDLGAIFDALAGEGLASEDGTASSERPLAAGLEVP